MIGTAFLLPLAVGWRLANAQSTRGGDIIVAALILGFFILLAACVRYVTLVGWPWKKKSS